MIKPNELYLIKELKHVKNEQELLNWLARFSSLKEIIHSVKLKWEFVNCAQKEENKGVLIKEFCLKLGEFEELNDEDKKKIFKILQFSIKINKSKSKIKKQNSLSNDTLNLLISNKRIEIKAQNRILNKKKLQKKLSRKVLATKKSILGSQEEKLLAKLKELNAQKKIIPNMIVKKESSCQTQVTNEVINKENKANKAVCFMCLKYFVTLQNETNDQVNLHSN